MIPALEAELAAIEAKIEAQYWRFSRSLSPRVPPPDGELYLQRNAIRDRLWNLRREEPKLWTA